MYIKDIELFHLKLPLKFSFKTAKANIDYRETIIIKITDENLNVGYGEVVSFTEPFYTKETLSCSKEFLINSVFPKLKGSTLKHPFDVHKVNKVALPMSMAGVENALLDIYSKRQGKNIVDLVFDEERNDTIKTGIVLGDINIAKLIKQIDYHLENGCTRFKIKIKSSDGFIKLKCIRDKYPDLDILVDANRSFGEEDMDELVKLDSLNLICIEEPLSSNNMFDYLKIKDKINTPICFDESVQSMEDLNLAIELGVIEVLNIKIGRVGGLYYAREMIDLCRENEIKFWVGSMLESGISKILHVQLASLKDTFIAGDLSASSRYFDNDLINPEIVDAFGVINVPKGIGLGVNVCEETLRKYMISSYTTK